MMLWFKLFEKTSGNNGLYLIMNVLAIVFSIIILGVTMYNHYLKRKNKKIVDDTSYFYILSLLVFLSGLLINLY